MKLNIEEKKRRKINEEKSNKLVTMSLKNQLQLGE
jgi:hypothetical protein